MRQIHRIVLAATLFGLPMTAAAQQIRIVCNIENGTMQTFHGKQEVFEPRIKKGQIITVEVQDFNNYLYEVEITETIEKTSPADEGFFKGFEALNLGGLLKQNVLPIPDFDVDGVADILDREPSTAGENAQVLAMLMKAERLVSKLESLESNLETASENTQKLVLDREAQQTALAEFRRVALNPQLPVSKIKTLGSSIFQRALKISASTQLNYDDILQKFEARKQFSKMLTTVMAEHFSYDQSLEELTAVHLSLQSTASPTTLTRTVFSDILSIQGRSTETSQRYERLATQLGDLEREARNDKLDDLMAIWLEYEALKINSFAKSHTTRGAGDAMIFDIKLKMHDSIAAPGAKREFALAPVKIPVYGGLKINTSLGVGFGQFFRPLKTYYLQDGLIQEEKGDVFVPTIMSLVHFYRQGEGNFSVGGSVGLGIPVGGSSANLQSLNFFLGPSFMFGDSERVVLSTGLMGGRSARLASVYQIGDSFLADADAIPMRRAYELGYFLGISYNLK